MDPVTIGLASIQLLGGISGMLGASAAKKRALRARQQAIDNMMRAMADEERIIQQRNAYGLMTQSGYLRDALQAQAGGLGSAMAQAGVWNSSAVAGALQKQARDNASVLADIYNRQMSELEQLRAKNKQFITSQQLGFAAQDYQQALTDEADTFQSIIAGLGALAQMGGQNKRSAPTETTKPTTGTNVSQNSGILSEWLRKRFQVPTSQKIGVSMNGNYNATLPPVSYISPRMTYGFPRFGVY